MRRNTAFLKTNSIEGSGYRWARYDNSLWRKEKKSRMDVCVPAPRSTIKNRYQGFAVFL